ncbi:GNAT family N-acetyltransferase [Negadavirga shengliensis]|uniref:GNAT family N-acetyltransferase n=1 Tax=Negadavirga shengliensis TaxID=1389218 RepID=A0ABV9SUX1_9BACT
MNSFPHLNDIFFRQELVPGDIGAITEMHGRIYHQGYGFGLSFEIYVAETFSDFARNFKDGLDKIWIAEHKKKIVGCIALVHRSPEQAQLRYFLIEPSFQGIGLGKELMARFMEAAKHFGYTTVYLQTTNNLPIAASLYRKAGFRLIDEKPSTAFGKSLMEQKYELIL